MYCCKDCGKKFEKPKIMYDEHGFKSPPYEKYYVCPVCKSENFSEKQVNHCKCCGARISEGKEYCDSTCRNRGERMWRLQSLRNEKNNKNPVVLAVREVEEYNRIHNTELSYGQYFARKG